VFCAWTWQAFYLYDTLGFPVDLTQLMAAERGLAVDLPGFAREMEAQKARSREAALRAKAGDGYAKPLLLQVRPALSPPPIPAGPKPPEGALPS
jgi:alanyl-tRNA synthetase